MKRILALALAFALSLSLSGCGYLIEEVLKEPASVSTGSLEVSEDMDSFEQSPPPEETVSSAEPEPSSQIVEPTEVETATDTPATIQETVLVDESGVKITARNLTVDEFWGVDLNLLIENNSGKDLTVQCRGVSVNGYMVDPLMSVDIVAGKKANEAMTFLYEDLSTCGIQEIADMEFSFHIFTSSDWETYLDTAPIQLKTSLADTYEYSFDDSGELAYDAEGIKIIVKGLSEYDSFFGPGIVIYLENNREEPFIVQTRDVSVNGFMVDGLLSSEVMPGKKAVDAITFFDSDLEDNGISAIETVELSFHIFNSETWDDIVDTEPVSIVFQ
jgi:hypothetical protein